MTLTRNIKLKTHSVWGLAELISRIFIEAVILCHIVVCVQVHLETGLLFSFPNKIIFQKMTPLLRRLSIFGQLWM